MCVLKFMFEYSNVFFLPILAPFSLNFLSATIKCISRLCNEEEFDAFRIFDFFDLITVEFCYYFYRKLFPFFHSELSLLKIDLYIANFGNVTSWNHCIVQKEHHLYMNMNSFFIFSIQNECTALTGSVSEKPKTFRRPEEDAENEGTLRGFQSCGLYTVHVYSCLCMQLGFSFWNQG